MKFYHISELEQLSGIKAHTIRIWEKRFNLIQPERTDTNIRMYNDDQVRKLLNVSTLLAGGYKISKIAELNEKDLYEKITALRTGVDEDGDAIALSYINDLVASMVDFNEAAFEKTFAAAVTRYGMFEAMLKVFYPLLQKIGLMWTTENVMPVQEHFASAIIRRKLLAAVDGQLPAGKKNKKFLLLLPPEEWHEIGLLFSDYLVRSKGVGTIYMGQNVPYENVPAVLKKTKITHVLLFFISRKTHEELHQLRRRMGLPADVELLVAGNPEITNLLSKEKHTTVLNSPAHLLKFL
jgi:DNA-binding transcriptional MerR regulator